MKKRNFIKIAKDVVASEIVGLKKLKSCFGKPFLKALDTISKCEGKLISTGIGKSGLIARKISATCSSTGTPSFYLHPGEASHGDLGQITKQDLLLIFSYSGQTEELKNIIGYANRFGIKIVGVASKKDSLLLKASDIKIVLPEVKEAGVGGLAPTSSTTAMLVFGDALAVALQHKKKFNLKLFKALHPAGQLGKMLTSAKDLMFTKSSIPLINENQNMKKAITLMSKKKLGCLVVKNKKNLVTGFISDGDLRRKSKNNLAQKKVKDIMTKNPIFVGESLLAVKAINIMNKKKITTLLVGSDKDVNKKGKKIKIKGILHIHTLLKKGIN